MADCYFFLTTGCNKGAACKFRHSAAAKASQETCPSFLNTGKCDEADCGKRHSSFHLNTTKSYSTNNSGSSNNVMAGDGNGKDVCYFERVKGACTKDTCPFKHFYKQPPQSHQPEEPPKTTVSKEAAWREAVAECNGKLTAIEDMLRARFSTMDASFEEMNNFEL